MKRHLALGTILVLGSLQLFASQVSPSQFSVRTPKERAAWQARQDVRHHAQGVTMPARLALTQGSAKTGTTAKGHLNPRAYTSNPPVSKIGFLSASQIPSGGGAYWTAISADFNGDGKMDFATPALNDDGVTYSISVVLSNGDGTFQSAQLTSDPSANSGDQILAGDFNHDGKQDLVVVHATNPSTFEVWFGNGDGTFNVGTHVLNSIGAFNLDGGVLTDVNGDGNLDLLVIDGQTPAHLWTILGNSNGTFNTPTSTPLTGGQLNDIVFADFNGDGALDFAASDASNNDQTVVYLAQGNGTYVAGTPLSTTLQNYAACNNSAGDLNGDGKPEIVTANCGNNSLIVYVNNGDGTFKSGVYYPAGANSAYLFPEAVTIADVNGDGNNDIVSSNSDGDDITVLLGNGDGTVNIPTVGYATGGYPRIAPLVGDFNGDGLADIVVPDNSYSFVYMQGYGDGTFRAAIDYFSPVPDTARAFGETIASADLNGDGYPDFVVGNCCDLSIGVTVFLSQPGGSLKPGVNYGAGGSLTSVAIADFDGDGKLDIAALSLSGNSVQLFHGNGDGTFTVAASYSTGGTDASGSMNGGFNQIVTGDFNQDGHPDLAIANFGSQNVSVLLNNGSGAFPTATTYPITGSTSAITAADLNGDGSLDLLIAQYNPGVVAVLLGNPDGTFQPATTPAFGFNYLGNLALGDLDGDGKLDLVVTVDDPTIPAGTGIAVAKGNGDGTFQAATLFSTTLQNLTLKEPYPGDVKMIDLDGDGKLDLVFTNTFYGTVGILYNTGTNSFATGMFYDPVEYPAGSYVYSLALADVNQDGATDVVMTDDGYAAATVLLNTSGSSNTLTSSANPVVAGKSLIFSAAIAATVRGVATLPTGSATFFDGSTSLGIGTLSNGLATFTTGSLAVGTHSITAQYGGDPNFHASTSTPVSEVVTAVVVPPTPDFSLAPTTASVTVKAGTSGSYTLNATPINGYSGTVTFSSTMCPAKATCVFNPTSVTLSGTAAISSTLTVTTTAATSSLVMPTRPNSKPAAPIFLASLSGLGIFGLVLAGSGKKRDRKMALVLGITLLLMMFTMFGCGGSNSNSSTTTTTGTPGTPAGSYTISVTGTGSGSAAPVHSTNLTLIVQ